jgi:hypothetical protein
MRKAEEMMRFCAAGGMNLKIEFRAAGLTGQLLQKLLFIQAIFERLPAVDENYGDLIRKLPFELVVGFDVNLAPAKASPALQLRELLLHDFAKVASLS